MLREGKAGHRGEIWATIIGLVDAQATYVRPDRAVVLGYGHLGAFPAELTVKRVVDIVVKSTPTYDYGEMRRRAPHL
jgi:hypothetical protein